MNGEPYFNGGGQGDDRLLSIMGFLITALFLLGACILVPPLAVILFIIAFLVALGKMSEYHDDWEERRRLKLEEERAKFLRENPPPPSDFF